MNKRKEEWENSPLFIKAEEILDLVERIVKIIEDLPTDDSEDEMIKNYGEYMMENALTIPAKISGAYSEDMLYDLKMENAAIIRKAAREILTHTSGLMMLGFKEVDYLQLLRNEIEEFRILFAEWVKTFDEWNYIIDRWGLFNPPGVSYDDIDPDDDLPFDADEFLD